MFRGEVTEHNVAAHCFNYDTDVGSSCSTWTQKQMPPRPIYFIGPMVPWNFVILYSDPPQLTLSDVRSISWHFWSQWNTALELFLKAFHLQKISLRVLTTTSEAYQTFTWLDVWRQQEPCPRILFSEMSCLPECVPATSSMANKSLTFFLQFFDRVLCC